MKPARVRAVGRWLWVWVVAVGASLGWAPPVEGKPPAPANRIYLVLLQGFDEPDDAFSVAAACVKFSRTEFWDLDEPQTRGSWEYTERDGKLTGFSLAATIIEDVAGLAVPVALTGQGRANANGRKSSLGGAGNLRAEILGFNENFGLTGREAKKAQCRRRAREINEALGVDDD